MMTTTTPSNAFASAPNLPSARRSGITAALFFLGTALLSGCAADASNADEGDLSTAEGEVTAQEGTAWLACDAIYGRPEYDDGKAAHILLRTFRSRNAIVFDELDVLIQNPNSGYGNKFHISSSHRPRDGEFVNIDGFTAGWEQRPIPRFTAPIGAVLTIRTSFATFGHDDEASCKITVR